MNRILKFSDYVKEELISNASYAGDWPLNKQEMGVTDGDVANNQDFARSEQKFQEVQEQMKQLLLPILKKKNPNADQHDVEKVSDSFFNLGNNKNQEIKHLVDNCKDIRQCAQDIINKYLKYVKINFNTKDNINDVEQDSVMTNEIIKFNIYE